MMLLPKSPLSSVYHWGDRINKWLKKAKTIKQAKVISIGNITTGGTGKTPAVIYFSQILSQVDYQVAILTRGYGGSKSKDGAVLTDGNKIFLTPEESGDEPFLIALNLKNIPIAVGKDRYAMGLQLQEKYQSNLFMLDDGFQHYALKRDVDIILIDALNPFGNGYMLPHGILREPLEALARADIVIITKANLISTAELEDLEKQLKEITSQQTIFKARHLPSYLVKLPVGKKNYLNAKKEPLDFLKNKKVWALAGIGSHRSFEKTLENLGALVHSISFRDHHVYSKKDIENILRRVQEKDIVVTTEKDWVRLQKYHKELSKLKNFYFLKIDFSLLENEILLQEVLKAKILTGKIS